MTLGPYTVSSQIFTGVTQLTDGLIDGELSGILGLAFQSLAVSQATPFWQALINGGQLSNPEMSFYLTRFLDDATSNTETDPGGTFTLGGTNSSLFKGDIQFNAFPSGFQSSFWLQTVSGELLSKPVCHEASLSTAKSAVAPLDMVDCISLP